MCGLEIEYLKSSISVNTFVGCTNDCSYCIVSGIKKELRKVEEIQSVPDALKNLNKYPYFVKDRSVISINNRTDPFLNIVISKSTLGFLRLINEKKMKNPILIITKMLVPKEILIEIDNMDCNVILFYSYSGLGEEFEHFSEKYRRLAMENIDKYWVKHKKVHYIRPIIPCYNDSYEKLKEMLQITKEKFDAAVISGIRINQHIHERFLRLSILLKNNDLFMDTKHKFLDKSVVEYVKQIKEEIGLENVFFHTSCVISFFGGYADYNSYFNGERCLADCPNQETCKRHFLKEDKTVCDIINNSGLKIDYKYTNGTVKVYSNMTQEQVSYLKHITRRKCEVEQVELSGSERGLVK